MWTLAKIEHTNYANEHFRVINLYEIRYEPKDQQQIAKIIKVQYS